MPALPVSTTIQIMDPDNYQTTYDSKTNIVVFYSLSNAFDLISGSKFREDIISKYVEIKMGHPVYQLANPYCLYTHAQTHCQLRCGNCQ